MRLDYQQILTAVANLRNQLQPHFVHNLNHVPIHIDIDFDINDPIWGGHRAEIIKSHSDFHLTYTEDERHLLIYKPQ